MDSRCFLKALILLSLDSERTAWQKQVYSVQSQPVFTYKAASIELKE